MITSSVTQETFCAQLTRQSNDPVFGTATKASVWFLLEYANPWPAKAVADNELPAQVQEFLSRQTAAIPRSRLLFIKQDADQTSKLRFFVVKTGELTPFILEFALDAYEDLLALDLAAIIEEPEAYAHLVRLEPLFLVCTNGKRDKCCAKFGRPLYDALRQSQGPATWQSSHIGGHRYAPNLLFLPHSVNFGLLTTEEAEAAAAAYLDGRIHDLARYRGRTYYAPHVQAADYFLRESLQYLALTGLRLLAADPVDENSWLIQFQIAADDEIHQLHVLREMTAQNRLVSCNSPAEKLVSRYRLLGHRTKNQSAHEEHNTTTH